MQGVAWTGIGIRWDNLLQPLNEDNNFSMADIYIMLSVDIVVHSLIFWYMDALLPGDFGMPKPVYFPFTVVYFSFFCIISLCRTCYFYTVLWNLAISICLPNLNFVSQFLLEIAGRFQK